MAKDTGIDAMPNHLQAAASILQEKLQVSEDVRQGASSSPETRKISSG